MVPTVMYVYKVLQNKIYLKQRTLPRCDIMSSLQITEVIFKNFKLKLMNHIYELNLYVHTYVGCYLCLSN